MQGCWCGLIGALLLTEAVCGGGEPEITAPTKSPLVLAPAKVCLDGVASPKREKAKSVIDRPMLKARGSSETFPCDPRHYSWFLDRPDRAVVAWRRMGARCVTILPRGQGTFAWTDEHGSEVIWEAIVNAPGQRIWFAEGKVKPGPVLPSVNVRAVVVMSYQEGKSADGEPNITHQTSLYVHSDSKSAAIVAKLLGNTAQRSAEQGLNELQVFFSGVSCYMHRHPERVEVLLKD